jgi:hypothetical protein
MGIIGASAPGEREAREAIERIGGHYEIESRFGLDCLGVVVEVELTECAPTARDLAKIKNLRHLRVLDLSRTPVGDRELIQLAGASCPFIIVPDGQTSEEVRAMFGEDQLALGIGVAEFALPGSRALSLPADGSPKLEQSIRTSETLAAKRGPAARKTTTHWRKS